MQNKSFPGLHTVLSPRKSQQKTSALAFYMLDSEYNASIGKVQPIL